MAITFQVSPVDRAREPLAIPDQPFEPNKPLHFRAERAEAIGASRPFRPSAGHGLVDAIGVAFAEHRPLVLSPDVIWLAIAQGFATHVNENAEQLRGKFVRHEGKLTLSVRRDDFVKGSPHNPWPEVFQAFSDEIAGHIGRQRDLVVCDFSTTGPIERAASEIALLDAMKSYFDFMFVTMCGIPEITLEGTVADWRSIRRRAQALDEYDLAWWTSALLPVLDALVATAEGHVDVPFWRSLFKRNSGSGGPYICGWINVLFPYVLSYGGGLGRNRRMAAWREGLDAEFGVEAWSIPTGISRAPFTWSYFGESYPMHFLAGFAGTGQDAPTLAVRPVIGWAVLADAPPRPVPTSLALIAGRTTSEQPMLVAEVEATIARVEALGREMGLPIACVPFGCFHDTTESPGVPLRCSFAIGLRLCAEGPCSVPALDDAVDAAFIIPPSFWTKAMEGLTVEDDGAVRLYLVAGGARRKRFGAVGELRFGAAGEQRSISVRSIDLLDSCYQIIECSRRAHDERRERARALGVEHGWAQYWLVEL